jgi:nicotinate-nucleotide adenylyltransferase
VSAALRLGVFGGTFDPVHLGHLIAAEEARLAVPLDRVLFIPSGQPPHRSKPPSASAEQRARMVALAINGHADFVLDEREVRAERVVYTIETLKALKVEHGPACRLHLIIGGDSLLDFPLWREPLRILDLATVVVIERPGSPLEGADPMLLGRVLRVSGARVAISAREIRDRLGTGRSVRYLVPEAVQSFIERNRLYAG